MSGKITLDDYKAWKKHKHDGGRSHSWPFIPVFIIVTVATVGATFILTAPPQAASATDDSVIGTITLINGDIDNPISYLVYVDEFKIGEGVLGIGQNVTLNVSVPAESFHYIMISNGVDALTILYKSDGVGFPKDFTFMLAPEMDFVEMT